MGSNFCGPVSAADDFGQQRISRKWFGDHGICPYQRHLAACGRPARCWLTSMRPARFPDVAHTTDSTETCSMLTVPNAASGTLVPSGSRPTAGRSVGKLIPPKTALLS
jgi:hypothetical protein